MSTRIKKIFVDIHKEEEWLNKQGEKGLMLIGYHNGEYEFEDVSPVKYQYRIDLPDYSGSRKKDYLTFLKECGIFVVAEYNGRVYLRKNKADGPLDLYRGNKEMNKQMNKRYAHFLTIGISQLILGIFLLIQTIYHVETKSLLLWIPIIVDVGLIISGSVFLITGIYNCKKNKVPEKEKDIWE